MTCRHAAGDRSCSSHPDNVAASRYEYEKEQEKQKLLKTIVPDIERFEVEDVKEVGNYLVMKVKYPFCPNCEYEGNKIMVFEGVKVIDVLKWKKIDPHFRKPPSFKNAKEAPPPIARFPGNPVGFNDACDYAERKNRIAQNR